MVARGCWRPSRLCWRTGIDCHLSAMEWQQISNESTRNAYCSGARIRITFSSCSKVLIHQRIKFNFSVLVYKCLHSTRRCWFWLLIFWFFRIENFLLHQEILFCPWEWEHIYKRRSLKSVAPKLWNTLASYCWTSNLTFVVFKRQSTTILFAKANGCQMHIAPPQTTWWRDVQNELIIIIIIGSTSTFFQD